MESKDKTMITVQAKIDAPIQKVWKCWTSAQDIVKWNHASDDWHTTFAEVDLRVGGKLIQGWKPKTGVLVLIFMVFMRKLLSTS